MENDKKEHWIMKCYRNVGVSCFRQMLFLLSGRFAWKLDAQEITLMLLIVVIVVVVSASSSILSAF